MNVSIVIAHEGHYIFAEEICETMYASALQRGTGIAKRTPEYIMKKMEENIYIELFILHVLICHIIQLVHLLILLK